MHLRIATYNIAKGVGVFGLRNRIHQVKTALASLDADLIFLQEVQGVHERHARRHADWPEQEQHDFLASASQHVAYGKNAIYAHGHHGNALLSRYPILNQVNHDVSDHAFESRGILHAVIDCAGVAVHCYVIHLGLFAASRKRQVLALIAAIKRDTPEDAPLIIAGDFNDWTMRLSPLLYEQLGCCEAFDTPIRTHPIRFWQTRLHARSFPARLPLLCLDRVYVRGFAVLGGEVKNSAPWSALSDHVPLVAQLQLTDA